MDWLQAGTGLGMLSIHGLEHRYGPKTALSLGHWEVARGERCLVLGASGSGKTTLLHIIAGLLRPSAGKIEVDGNDVAALPPAELDRFRARRVGIVLQKLCLLKSLDVLDNILLAQYLAGYPPDRAWALQLLSGLGLDGLASSRPGTLSQGQAQRVAIARAVVNRPALLLADEPTASLDDMACAQVIDTLFAQAEAVGATLLIATHDHRVKARIGKVLELPA